MNEIPSGTSSGSFRPHRWPERHFVQVWDVGVTTEPAGHDVDGEPLYDAYDSQTLEQRILREEDVGVVIELLPRNPLL